MRRANASGMPRGAGVADAGGAYGLKGSGWPDKPHLHTTTGFRIQGRSVSSGDVLLARSRRPTSAAASPGGEGCGDQGLLQLAVLDRPEDLDDAALRTVTRSLRMSFDAPVVPEGAVTIRRDAVGTRGDASRVPRGALVEACDAAMSSVDSPGVDNARRAQGEAGPLAPSPWTLAAA
jgi:hypothetical protein